MLHRVWDVDLPLPLIEHQERIARARELSYQFTVTGRRLAGIHMEYVLNHFITLQVEGYAAADSEDRRVHQLVRDIVGLWDDIR